ncbi:MAG: membrane protein insertion efficiency factor YidD, partial [Fervidobacterium sp.]
LLQIKRRIQGTKSPVDYFLLNAISYYQRSISEKSVSRCPFEISCSQFATIAIEKYGLLGFIIFIDRYFYRENVSAFSLYNKKETKNGIIKLDDKIYLFPFK